MVPEHIANEEKPPRGDEVTPIAEYMAAEMVRNARSLHADRIREMNERNMHRCYENYQALSLWQRALFGGTMLQACTDDVMVAKLMALAEWTLLVRENGPWDHKPIIARRFRLFDPTANEQHWHHYNGFLYFYDIWSNIHYGYVGRACGFTESELLDGAGLEQIGSDLYHRRLPRASPGVSGLRRFDDPSDRASVSIGIFLYNHLKTVTVSGLLGWVEKTPGLTRKPLK